ncbi:MAG: hypothetical protein JSW52_06415 [Candidatus Coatesbacteria bacterium]|nr:MAG: hypothetical protein JSW52_06415 [Candidatus Coatesbacteria bacterium]
MSKYLPVFLGLALAVGAFASTNVLICHYDYAGQASSIMTEINNDAYFDSVTEWNILNSGIPSVADLGDYDGVLTWNNYFYTAGEAQQMGDNLADYVDDGGGVVVTIWSIAQVTGRFASDPDYNPLNGGTNNHTYRNLGTVHEPDHPLMDGVSSINNMYYGVNSTVESGALLVCEASDGRPLGAVNAAENVAAIDCTPRSTKMWSGDGWVLLLNALKVVMVPMPGEFNLLTPADGEVIDVFDGRGGEPDFVAEAMSVKNAGTITFYNRTNDPVDVDVEFTWEESPNATEYELIVDDDYTFNSPVLDETGIEETTYTHTFSVDSTITYYWRVIASNEYGEQQCNEDFEFEFNYNNTSIAPASLGEVKATFR